MGIKKIFEFLMDYPLTAAEGVRIASDRPLKHTLRLVRIVINEARTLIELEREVDYDKFTGDEEWIPCTISIENESRRFYWPGTTDFLFDRQRRGSGTIGVIGMSVPVIIPLMPYIVLTNRYYNRQERIYGMSRHALSVLKALEGQLPPDTEQLLRDASRFEWQFEQKRSQQLSLAQAQEYLMRCKSFRQSAEILGVHHEQQIWWDPDDGGACARTIRCTDDVVILEVLGSMFEGQEARDLMQCYREIVEK